MGRVLIVFTSRANETKGIAELIAEGVRQSGHEVTVKNTGEIQSEEDLKGYDAYAFGSPTYHGDMMTPMKQMLFMGERAELKGKPGGSFGAYGWSGEAAPRILNTMRHIYQMETLPEPLMLKASWAEGGVDAAQDYGKRLAAMI